MSFITYKSHSTWHIMADMICHKVYEFLMSILSVYYRRILIFRRLLTLVPLCFSHELLISLRNAFVETCEYSLRGQYLVTWT